jgi:hypothetical protein
MYFQKHACCKCGRSWKILHVALNLSIRANKYTGTSSHEIVFTDPCLSLTDSIVLSFRGRLEDCRFWSFSSRDVQTSPHHLLFSGNTQLPRTRIVAKEYLQQQSRYLGGRLYPFGIGLRQIGISHGRYRSSSIRHIL